LSIRFNADEVFEMALQIERNGAKFYRHLAGLAASQHSRELFLHLAAMEDEHERVFAQMRAQLTEQEKQPLVPDPEGESALYLQAMANGYVFDLSIDPTQNLAGRETPEAILQMAIGYEKDSIAFYEGMQPLVPPRLGQERLREIIAQEMGHIALLSRELASLKKG